MQATYWVYIGLVAVASAGGYSTLAQSPASEYTQIPEAIQVPGGLQPLLTVGAIGSQIYTCQVTDDSKTFEWTLKAPEAVLLDQQGQRIGQHYGGPTWEMEDGSKVIGELQTRVDAPQSDDIPWLLLQVKSHEGDGVLSEVNWIQRVNTDGGKSPSGGCDHTHQNQEIRVDYSADYYFYKQE